MARHGRPHEPATQWGAAVKQVQRKGSRVLRKFGRNARGQRTPAAITASIFQWLGILILAAIVAAILLFVMMYIFARVPAPGDIPTPQRVTILASDEKTVLGTIIPEAGNRKEVSSEQIPRALKYATMAAEDRDFENNKGFSITGFGRAAIGQLTGNNAGGGSTITQQYVKNALVGNKRSYWRKFKELVLSMKMANQWSKDDILTAYLNTIYFGRGTYGVETASQAYFGKSVEDINPSQAALLAAVIQQPSNLDPAVNETASKSRWNYVVSGMKGQNWISAEEANEMSFPKTKDPDDGAAGDDKLAGPNGLLKQQVMRELSEKGIDEQEISVEGLRIVTTISADAQNTMVKAMKKTLKGQPKKMRAAGVSIDPQTGGVLAYYGGSLGSGFDYAMSSQMTGSSFKVFGLAAGLDQGIPLSKMYSSAPYKIGRLTIRNSENMSCGTCTIAQATVMSLNTSYYRLMMDLKHGPGDVADMAHKAGIPKKIDGKKTLQDPDGTIKGGIVLGMYPVRPFDMASGFATFADRGIYHEPYFVEKAVTDGGAGRIVYEHEKSKGERVMKKKVADNVSSALQPIASYSNNHGLKNGRPSAAKTGTVQLGDTGKNRDAWMVGYTPQVSTAVWFGTQNGTALTTKDGADVWGATLPSDVWQEAMNGAHKDLPVKQFPTPDPIGGQAGYPYQGGTSSTDKDKDTKKNKDDDDEDKLFDDITITRPTLPGIPGIENPLAPPTTVTRDPDPIFPDDGDDGVLWR